MDTGPDERTLRRIIALLVSFAGLAEHAAGRSLPVRWLILTILRHAQGVALGYLAETTGLDRSACFDGDPEPGCGPDDAAVLAWRFRMLAALLRALLPPEDRLAMLQGRTTARATARPSGTRARPGPAAPGGWPHHAPDTS